MHAAFNYLICSIVLANIIFLLMASPVNDPTSSSFILASKLDLACTCLFILEALLKIIALGFANSSIPTHKAYIYSLWNIADFTVIFLAVMDQFFVFPRFDNLLNSFKALRSIHLLRLSKKNDLLEIIINTMNRAFKPIMITLLMSIMFIFIYGLIGVTLFRGQYYYCEIPINSGIVLINAVTKFDCIN